MKNIDQKGFNLLTMTAVILALGAIMFATIGFYNTTNTKQRILVTKNKFNRIDYAMRNYIIQNNRFPCPAPLNCDSEACINNSLRLGHEARDSDGKCISDNSGIFLSENSEHKKLLYGGVPAITLGLSNSYIADSWGNKIVYIIPEELASSSSFQELIFNKYSSIGKEYVKNGIIYLLISFNKHNNGAFPYINDRSNSFSGTDNLPVLNFSINTADGKYYYFHKTVDDFDISNFEEEILDCPETTEIVADKILTFPKGKYGEIVFSNEFCPTNLNSPPQANDYYYRSTYTDGNTIIDNRPAKKCGKYGKWEEGFVYECLELPKCKKPSSVYLNKDWSDFNFAIVNLGEVYDKDSEVKMKCIVTNDGAKWYDSK